MKRELNGSDPTYPAAMQMFTLLRTLQRRASRAMRVNDLAEALDVDRRTIVRYANALAACVDNDDGEPLVRRERRDGEAWVVLNDTEEPMAKGLFHYAATFAAAQHLAGGGSVLKDSVDDVLGKLRDGLGADSEAIVRRVAKSFHYVAWGPKDYRRGEDVVDAVVQGVIRRRPVELRYRARDAQRADRRRMEPWTIVMYRDGLYVYGRVIRSNGTSDMRIYALDRIESATLDRTAHFTVPEGYEPDRELGTGLGLWQTGEEPARVELAFSPDAAVVARERQWPGFVAWSVLDDGRDLLVIETPVTPEVVSWVLTWGPQIEVLAPGDLRAAVAMELANALARYGP